MKRRIISLSCMFLLCSCGSYNGSSENDRYNVIHEKLQTQKQILCGKKISSLETILGDSVDKTDLVIYLYDGFDCGDCVKRGFEIIRTLPDTYVIATSGNVGYTQLANDYPHHIFTDEHNFIRKELKFVLTPVILMLDGNRRIKQILFPGVSSQENEKVFLQTCKIIQETSTLHD